jgi:hypothetical protein
VFPAAALSRRSAEETTVQTDDDNPHWFKQVLQEGLRVGLLEDREWGVF